MYQSHDQYPVQVIPNMKGGEGHFDVETLVPPQLLGKAGTLFARGTLPPGCSVGLHTHTANMEVCYVLSGSGLVEDAQAGRTRLNPGDTHICLPSDAHKILNDGTVPLVYLAVGLNP